MTEGKPKTRWQDKVAPEIIASIGKPRSGERMGQYLMRWFSRAFAARNDGDGQ